MDLALRRFEIVLVFCVAAACAYAGAAWYFGVNPVSAPLFLIPRPVVLNEREAILDTLSERSIRHRLNEEARLKQLQVLASSTPVTHAISSDERLRLLNELARGRRDI